ncbi:TPA: hypothetical protein ACMDVJ_001524 [Vibrio parahaemolyticus]
MKRVFIFIYAPFRLKLYHTIAKELKKKNYNVHITVQDIYSYVFLKLKGFNVTLLRIKSKGHMSPGICIHDSIDIISGHLNDVQGTKLASGFSCYLSNLSLSENDVVFCGNGYHIQDLVLKKYKEKIGFKTIFSELSNIDGKTFFDIEGSNASSKYYSSLVNSVLEFKELDSQKIYYLNSWKENYKNKKRNCHIVKQSLSRNKFDTVKYLLCNCIELILNVPSFSVMKVKSNGVLKKYFLRKRVSQKLDYPFCQVEDLDEGYFFFPLQVTDDSQIKINSNYDNLSALKVYLEQAKKADKKLVVKLHPAEKNEDFIMKVRKMSESGAFLLTTSNTFEVISKSDCVCVINSTVGLESILLNKETKFLGKSFYSFLKNDSYLYHYLFDYLVDIDFFTGDSNTTTLIEDIFDR